jgi:hypothetical protein
MSSPSQASTTVPQLPPINVHARVDGWSFDVRCAFAEAGLPQRTCSDEENVSGSEGDFDQAVTHVSTSSSEEEDEDTVHAEVPNQGAYLGNNEDDDAYLGDTEDNDAVPSLLAGAMPRSRSWRKVVLLPDGLTGATGGLFPDVLTGAAGIRNRRRLNSSVTSG